MFRPMIQGGISPSGWIAKVFSELLLSRQTDQRRRQPTSRAGRGEETSRPSVREALRGSTRDPYANTASRVIGPCHSLPVEQNAIPGMSNSPDPAPEEAVATDAERDPAGHLPGPLDVGHYSRRLQEWMRGLPRGR